ncbi:sulfotransferase family 2, cytosolic sulfotransferase 3 isoform X2 [Myxocyprinus asiaticus]|uniref:sulfotransferase family 2, cytosolic sulfotransferase 3 isoform X2 n=1 Tax=Myxocyprinus asiaticus TaxID=70543 RepID=UPI0022216BAC|nr:sulfotransferase family 2, cytosolic sulfotransferase 3 isoform X2 [Myxocyprinus asiaticus]
MESVKYIDYHGLMCPKESHSKHSFRYFEKFSVMDNDVFIITYPKSGTTWMQEILPLLLNGGDLTVVQTIPNWDRVPWLEETRASSILDKIPSPRAMVSHMPYHLMPQTFFNSKAKVIYVTRNPKDVLVSSFHFHKMASFLDEPGTLEEFTDKFLAGNVFFGKWTDHVKSWQNTDLGDRILYITYEDMLQDLRGVLVRILTLLGRQLSADALDRVVDHCTFKNMKTNTMSNYSLVPQNIMDCKKSSFLRKGIAGDWKNHFSPELDAKFTAAIQEEMNGSNISFPWDEE